MRVLTIGRDQELQLLRARVLMLSGIDVLTPTSTEEAAAAIWTTELDALLLCYSLPNRDAIFLAELFRQFRPQGCLVAITNHSLPDRRIGADVQIPGIAGPEAIIAVLKRKCVLHSA